MRSPGKTQQRAKRVSDPNDDRYLGNLSDAELGEHWAKVLKAATTLEGAEGLAWLRSPPVQIALAEFRYRRWQAALEAARDTVSFTPPLYP